MPLYVTHKCLRDQLFYRIPLTLATNNIATDKPGHWNVDAEQGTSRMDNGHKKEEKGGGEEESRRENWKVPWQLHIQLAGQAYH